jgi:NADH:ubiquinone oxidoreductase subunit K
MAQEEPVIMSDTENSGEKPFKIKRGRVDSLSLFEITEHELNILESGSPSSLFLNFALLLLSTATSFLIALTSTTISSDRVFAVFTIIVVIGYIAGIVLFVLWWRNRQSTATIIKRIRQRIPSDELPGSDTEGENPPRTNKTLHPTAGNAPV